MDAQQIKLYQRIQEFSLDEADTAFPLSQKLARENGWTAQYTQRVMDEFKKFMFLAVVAGHPVTPSEQVDQVWHLYLTYTHSYWNKFCAKVLQKPIHHNPTRGGVSEYQKFYKWYTNTLISYERFFDQSPPSDIWPSPVIRFGQEFRRVDTQAYWLIPKPSLQNLRLRSLLSKPGIITLLSLIMALLISGSLTFVAGATDYSTHSTDSQPLLAQVAKTHSELLNIFGYKDWITKIFASLSGLSFFVAIVLITLSGLSFFFAIFQFICLIILINKPVFVSPVGNDNFKYSIYDRDIYTVCNLAFSALLTGLLSLVSIPLLLLPFHFQLMGFTGFYALLRGSIHQMYGYDPTKSWIWLNHCFGRLGKNSVLIRPLHCEECKKPLRNVTREISLEMLGLSQPQIVAAKLNGVELQVWHCSYCYSQVDKKTVHSYMIGDYKHTKYCPNCREKTMRITYKTYDQATQWSEGKGIEIYTCECCGRKDERTYTIPYVPPEPPNNDMGCGGCGCM